MKNFLFVFCLLISCSTLWSQTATTNINYSLSNEANTLKNGSPADVNVSAERLDLIDQHIQSYIEAGHVPGGVFLLSRNGKIIYNKAFGQQTNKADKPYQKDNIFRLASMTKAFTTVAIMQLVESGKLRLDDPVFYYIPSFKNSQVLTDYTAADTTYTTVPAQSPITIRQLLTHTSGITYGTFNPGKIEAIYTKMGAANFGLANPQMTTAEMVDQIAKLPLIFQPGDRYLYGLNMEVLGRVVEVISQQPLNQYFKQHIFEPLDMKATGFYLPKETHSRLVPAYTYNQKGEIIMAADTDFGQIEGYPTWPDNNHYAGGGGASGSTMDYAVFIQMLLNGGVYNGKRIISRKSIDVMTSDQLVVQNAAGKGRNEGLGRTMGLGFGVTLDAGQATSYKSPGTFEWGGYFNTKYFIDPSEDLIFVGMTQIVPFQRPDFWDKLYALIYSSLE
ncbi:MAG: serine hydrolase domain-containing protein [Saprospiraceae bacterium]